MPAKAAAGRKKQPKRSSVWLQPAEPARSDPPLSRERIVAAAIELLDANGVSGLTMRKLADHLGSGVMSLYWHVDNKEDVFELALDQVLEYRRPALPGPSANWREEVTHLAQDWRAAMLAHPWSASLLERPALGPNVLARIELLAAALSAAGVPDEKLNVAIWSLYNYVMGATIVRASLDLSDADRAASQQRLEQLSGRFPTIERLKLFMDDDWDGAFRKGLGYLLDGIGG